MVSTLNMVCMLLVRGQCLLDAKSTFMKDINQNTVVRLIGNVQITDRFC